MTSIIYQRGIAREATIWPVFEHNGPFSTVQGTERTTMFGIYANTYLHGHNYLSEIETEDLARLVDAYNAAIARITTEEAQLVLEVAGKRYVEQIDEQIHADNLITRGKKIDFMNDDYDARDDALDADREALVTKQQQVQLAWDKADQKIKDLEMRRELEEVAQDLVDVDIAEQQLRAAKADLAVIEAGLKGLDIQLSITQAGIDLTNTELAITNAEAEVDKIGIRVSETEVQESGVDLDITNAGTGLSKSLAAGERTKADTKGVAIRVAETDLQIVETGAKQLQIDAEVSKIEADTSKLSLVDSEKTIMEADKRIAAAENKLLVQEKYLIDSKGNNVTDETFMIEDQQEKQEILDGKQVEHEDTRSKAEIDMSKAETGFKDEINDKKVEVLDGNKTTLVDDKRARHYEDAQDKADQLKIKWQAQEAFKDAAVRAAEMIAEANLISTLTHSIGEGTAPEPTQSDWKNISSI